MDLDDRRSEMVVDQIQCGDGIVRLRIIDNQDPDLPNVAFWSVNSVKALQFAAFLIDWAIFQDDDLRERYRHET